MMQVTYALSEWDRNYAMQYFTNPTWTYIENLVIIYFGKKLKKDP